MTEYSYNQISGRSPERLAALSDGVFAVAMTLLVLDMHTPASDSLHSEHELLEALAALLPRFIPYLTSFMTLGIFWIGQQAQLNQIARADRHFSWIHLTFLFMVTLQPFSTTLMAGFITYRTALLVYWLNIFLLGIMLFASWHYACRAGLLKADISPKVNMVIRERILKSQMLYAFGASLCIYSAELSIAFIFVVQLNYAVVPSIGALFGRVSKKRH